MSLFLKAYNISEMQLGGETPGILDISVATTPNCVTLIDNFQVSQLLVTFLQCYRPLKIRTLCFFNFTDSLLDNKDNTPTRDHVKNQE